MKIQIGSRSLWSGTYHRVCRVSVSGCPDKCSLGRVYGVWSTKTAQYRRIKLSKQNEQEQTSERTPQQTKVVGWRWPSEASDRHTIVVHWNSFLGHDITELGHRSSEV